MRKTTVSEFSKPLSSIIVTCRQSIRCGRSGILTSINVFPSGEIDEERVSKLTEAHKIGTPEFISKLVELNTQDSILTESSSGSSYLLPEYYQRFYQNAVRFSSEKCNIYFADMAIHQFKKTIYALDEKCRQDSLKFVRAKLESHEVNAMSVSLLSSDCERSLRVGLEEKTDHTVSLVRHIPQDKAVCPKDIQELLQAIEIFAEVNGMFHQIAVGENNIIAYNQGNIKITGLEKAPELKEKVLEIYKRR